MNAAAASSNICAVRDVGKEKCILWLGTYYFDSIPYNLANMNDNIIWKSEIVKPPYVDILLEFQFVRISSLEFRITCIRVKSPPAIYTLRFHCSVNVLLDGPKVFQLHSSEFITFERFWLEPSYRQRYSLNDLNRNFEFKILVEVIEYDGTSTGLCMYQEDEFRLMKDRFFNYEPALSNLSYILQIPRVQGIFSGLQNNDFAVLKSNYIRRTAVFSREIVDYLKAKDSGISVPLTDLGLILNYILNFEQSPISNADLTKVYFQAFRTGLNFLVSLSRDCIMARIKNENFINDALMAADLVNDKFLFDKIAESFHCNENEFINSEWLERLKSSNIQCRFMVYSLERRFKRIEPSGRAHTGESSKSDKIKWTSL